MKFAIDVLFVAGSKGSAGGFQVIQVHHSVAPWRLVWHGGGPSQAVELAAGTATACGIDPGSRLAIRYL
jgi:uncharacterized membrane protein (UPF0127 family)